MAALLLIVACGDANRQYVRKAVHIMDRQGPRTADAIEQVAALLHPELFN